MKIIQIGRYPPPFGGVTIHIQRLAEKCLSKGIDCEVLDLYFHASRDEVLPEHVLWPKGHGLLRYINLIGLLRSCRCDIAHFHVSAMGKFAWVAPFMLSLLRSSRRIVTIHHGDFVEAYERRTYFEKVLIRRIFHSMDIVIFPTRELQIKALNALGQNIRRSRVVNTYIAFDELELSQSFEDFEVFSDSTVGRRPQRLPILLISGYGLPHYGFDLLYRALDGLKREGKSAAVVISFYGQGDPTYMAGIVERYRNLGPLLVVSDLKPSDFRYLLQACDVYVRPTTIDSCGVTVYEALSCGTVCVASDVCERPLGTILHKGNDVDSLIEKLRHAIDLSMQNRGKKTPHTLDIQGGEIMLLEIYQELVG